MKNAVFVFFLSTLHILSAYSAESSNSFFEKALFHLDLKSTERSPKLGNFYLLKTIEQAKKNNNKATLGQSYKFLADSFYSGDGIDQSEHLALYYYKLSAKHKYAPAYFNIAAIFKHQKKYKLAKHYINEYIKCPKSELKKEALQFKKSLKFIS